ncbi:transmembrane protein 177 [Diorhabda carinulata]|uniref:transmembrane protein 177 n=1 Tax=Diorhabda carinulata TaxID=1163345 RepID=UPI0025A0CDAF|nr:transmembrane protein 177 [Diorhabda carinulata]
MYVKKIASFMNSEGGRKVSYFLAGTISVGAMCSYFVPHTLLLNEYRKLIQLYNNGISVPVSKEIENRFQKALDLLKIDPKDIHLYKPFHVYGFDVMSAGSSYSKYGAIIGIPINFTFQKPETIDRSKMRINHEAIVWDSEPAQNLLKSLVLSEKAQLYAMSREVLYRQTLKPLLDVFLATNLVLSSYFLGRNLKQKFNFSAKPLGLRIMLYTLVGIFNFGIYIMAKDLSQMYYEKNIDLELKKTDIIFLQGGKEFYSKLLERNKALRQLLGKDGERLYSVLGNENYILRQKHIPLVQRLSSFDDTITS